MTEANALTDAQRLAIRLELAKVMGWRVTTLPGWQMAWLSPDETTQDEPPDPFTSAADNRALVEWVASQNETFRLRFDTNLKIGAGYDNHPFYTLSAHKALASPLEAITMAAAAALGITAPPPAAAPPPAPPEAQRRE